MLVKAVAKDRFGREVTDTEVREALAAAVAKELEPVAEPLPHRARFRPQVVLVCGVNGTGKTTTIGKLANQAVGAGLKVVLAACDTFRAAAVEQLEVWGRRNGVPVIRGKEGADPAGLAFDALERARAEGADLLMIDTAGRLQNKQALMDELRKIVRVLKKVDPEAPHDVVLVLDATTGQNAHNQVEVFKDLVDLTGLIMTKLDGTAKGGVVVALARRFGLPIHAIGVGETIDDLRAFEAGGVRARPARAGIGRGRLRKAKEIMSRNIVETLLGAAVLAVALGFLAWAYGRSNAGDPGGYRLRAKFDRVDGLDTGGDVRMSGIKVGKVLAQELDPATYRAQVDFSVRNGIELPADSSAAIVSSGLLGGKYLSLVPGGDEQAAGGWRGDHADPVLGQSRGPDRPLHLQRPGRAGRQAEGPAQ